MNQRYDIMAMNKDWRSSTLFHFPHLAHLSAVEEWRWWRGEGKAAKCRKRRCDRMYGGAPPFHQDTFSLEVRNSTCPPSMVEDRLRLIDKFHTLKHESHKCTGPHQYVSSIWWLEHFDHFVNTVLSTQNGIYRYISRAISDQWKWSWVKTLWNCGRAKPMPSQNPNHCDRSWCQCIELCTWYRYKLAKHGTCSLWKESRDRWHLVWESLPWMWLRHTLCQLSVLVGSLFWLDLFVSFASV